MESGLLMTMEDFLANVLPDFDCNLEHVWIALVSVTVSKPFGNVFCKKQSAINGRELTMPIFQCMLILMNLYCEH